MASTPNTPREHVIVPDKDVQQPVDIQDKDTLDDVNAEDPVGDGFVHGDEEEDDDEDEDEDGESIGKGSFNRHPLASWICEPFKHHLQQCQQRCNEKGQPYLYTELKAFYFPRPSSFFLLNKSLLKPQDLYNPEFFLWDPESLCANGIPCLICKHHLHQHSPVSCP